jgi:hypothetical protein
MKAVRFTAIMLGVFFGLAGANKTSRDELPGKENMPHTSLDGAMIMTGSAAETILNARSQTVTDILEGNGGSAWRATEVQQNTISRANRLGNIGGTERSAEIGWKQKWLINSVE